MKPPRRRALRVQIVAGVAAILLMGGTLLASAGASSAIGSMPTPPPSPTSVCAPLLPSRLIVYERGRVTDDEPLPSNLREGPGTAYALVGEIPANGLFFVLEGPKCSQRYLWYRVRYGDLEGWIAEGTTNSYYTELYLPG